VEKITGSPIEGQSGGIELAATMVEKLEVGRINAHGVVGTVCMVRNVGNLCLMTFYPCQTECDGVVFESRNLGGGRC
jgi:hypothetical protein